MDIGVSSALAESLACTEKPLPASGYSLWLHGSVIVLDAKKSTFGSRACKWMRSGSKAEQAVPTLAPAPLGPNPRTQLQGARNDECPEDGHGEHQEGQHLLAKPPQTLNPEPLKPQTCALEFRR